MVRYHGNWCGPNWTAGQYKPTSDLTLSDRSVPAVDALDQACKDHDIDLHDAETPEDVEQANEKFIAAAAKQGLRGKAAAALVSLAGPSKPTRMARTPYDRPTKHRYSKKLRGAATEEREIRPDGVPARVKYAHLFPARDPEISNVLDQEEEDADIREFMEDIRDQQEETKEDVTSAEVSRDNSPNKNGLFFEDVGMVHRIDEDRDGDTSMAEPSNAVAPNNALVRTSANAGTQTSGRSRGNQATMPRQLKPIFPFHNTTEAILEYHFSKSMNDIPRGGDTNLNWRFRMNSYVQPLALNNNNLVNQLNYTVPVRGVSSQAVGRYCFNPGITGALIEANYHRALSALDDATITNYTLPEPAGADWYNALYQCYTVTKCEWTIYIDFPWHHMKGTWETDDAPNATQVAASLVGNTAWETDPPQKFKLRAFTSYGTTGDTVTEVNHPVTQATLTMERWQNTFENKVTVPVNQTRVIKGTWYPGKVKHNPVNDADMEIWTPVANLPTTGHTEFLTFILADSANSGTLGVHKLCANVSFNFKWYVQFKDQKQQVQFPYSGQTDINLPLSDLMFQEDPAQPV